MNPLKRLFWPEYMVKKHHVQGGLPSAREAYGTCLKMAWPSALESVLVALVSSVDTMMVGQLGPAAISAVGITTQPKFILLAVIITLNVGVTAIVARRKGEGDLKGANRCLKQALVISLTLSAVMTAVGLIFTEPLLRIAGAGDDFIVDAVAYFRIILTTNVFNCCAMTMNAAQRGFGNTRVSMVTNVSANLVNVALNYLLINGIWIFPRLGVRGAAVATACSSVVMFSIALISVTRHTSTRLSIIMDRSWKFDRRTVGGITKVGSSALVEQLFMRVGFFVFALLVAKLGTIQFATHQICMNLINISFAFGDGLGVASTSLVGQGLGMKRPDLSIIYGKTGQRCAVIMGVMLAAMFIIFRRDLILLFNNDPDVVALGSQIVYIIAITSLAQTSQVVISGCLRGAGDSKFVAVSSFICVGVIRTVFSWFLCYPCGLGLVGLWLGLFSDQFMRLVLNFIRFRSAKWTKIEL